MSDQDRFETFIQEVTAETVNSFAIEDEVRDPEQVTASLIASMRANDQQAAGGQYRHVADVMIDVRNTERPLSVEQLNDWHALLFQREPFMKDVCRLRSDEMQVVTMKRHEIRVQKRLPNDGSVIPDLHSLGYRGWRFEFAHRAAIKSMGR